jgi:hypothetical protein
MFFRFILRSARVVTLVIVSALPVHVKEWKMGDLSDFEKGQTVGARLAGASATKTITLLGVSMVMSTYTNHGKTTSATRNSGRKSTLTEIDGRMLRIVQKNHRTTAAQVNCSRTEYSS